MKNFSNIIVCKCHKELSLWDHRCGIIVCPVCGRQYSRYEGIGKDNIYEEPIEEEEEENNGNDYY